MAGSSDLFTFRRRISTSGPVAVSEGVDNRSSDTLNVQTQSSEIIIGSSASDGGREKGNDQRQAVRLAFFVISVVFGLLPTRERRRLLHPAAARKKKRNESS